MKVVAETAARRGFSKSRMTISNVKNRTPSRDSSFAHQNQTIVMKTIDSREKVIRIGRWAIVMLARPRIRATTRCAFVAAFVFQLIF
jgi:hypothetical protein